MEKQATLEFFPSPEMVADLRAKERELELTSKVLACTTFQELKEVIAENAPFIVVSKGIRARFGYSELVDTILATRQQCERGLKIQLFNIPAVNGIRAKAAELFMTNNNFEGWT